MPILVKCDCGHEITVADSMQGRKGRCPQCDAVLTIPGPPEKRPRRGAFVRPPRQSPGRSRGSLSLLATGLTVLGLLSLLAFAAIGVYTGVTAFRGAHSFHGPFGLFSGAAPMAKAHPIPVGVAFILGGFVVGGFAAVVLAAVGQCLKLFLSLEQSLSDIADRLGS